MEDVEEVKIYRVNLVCPKCNVNLHVVTKKPEYWIYNCKICKDCPKTLKYNEEKYPRIIYKKV